MRSWKESHYQRATEFTRLLAEALAAASAGSGHAPAISAPRPLQPAQIPKPAAPTTAALFKSIPWKK